METKFQTLILYPNGEIAKRMDGFIYQPKDCIIIKDVEWKKWKQYDDFNCELVLVRKIFLEN